MSFKAKEPTADALGLFPKGANTKPKEGEIHACPSARRATGAALLPGGEVLGEQQREEKQSRA